ncbi:unnamed protein product [Ixodes pacificus]
MACASLTSDVKLALGNSPPTPPEHYVVSAAVPDSATHSG